MRVLLVEDDAENREVMALALQAVGCTVVEASGAEEAIELVGDHIDVMLVDLSLPDHDGWWVAEQAHERVPGLRIVFLTGWGSHIGRADARARGVEAVLTKPATLATLTRVLGVGIA